MPTIKIEYYRSKLLANGEHPIRITVTHKGVPKGKTVASCLPEDWDDKNKKILGRRRKDANRINREISDAYDKYYDIFKLFKDGGMPWKSEDVFTFEQREVKEERKTYWEIAQEYADSLKIKSGQTYITFTGAYKKFREYVCNDNLLLSEIDEKLINGFISYCRKAKNMNSTIITNIKILRLASNYGARMKYDAKPSALHDFKLPKKERGKKSKVPKVEVDKISITEFAGKLEEIRDMWILEFYLRGMRISDLMQLKEKYIKKDRIEYVSEKNNKVFNIKLTAEASRIIEKYKTGTEYLFSFYKYKENPKLNDGDNNVERAKHLRSITGTINIELKKIAKAAGIDVKLSTHIARHSFAKYALDKLKGLKLDNSIDISMGLLGHSSLEVHELYVTEIMSDDDLNDAADKIFD